MLLDRNPQGARIARAATPISRVGVPGREDGVKLTVPSSAELAIAAWVPSNCGCGQRP